MRAAPVRSRNAPQKTQTDGRNAQRAVRSHSHIGLSEPKRELLLGLQEWQWNNVETSGVTQVAIGAIGPGVVAAHDEYLIDRPRKNRGAPVGGAGSKVFEHTIQPHGPIRPPGHYDRKGVSAQV